MKKVLILGMILMVVALSSCTNYTHKKIIKNSTRETIEVVSGCCGDEQHYIIEPGSSETVFACIYQQMKQPENSDLSWNFTIRKNDGEELKVDVDSEWEDHSVGNTLEFVTFLLGIHFSSKYFLLNLNYRQMNYIYLGLALTINLAVFGQNVPNGDFENWTLKADINSIIDTVPDGWTFRNHYLNSHQISNSFSGNYALLAGVTYGYMIEYVTLGDGFFDVLSWNQSGIPFVTKPQKMGGYYKYLYSDNALSPLVFDTASISILLKGNSGALDTVAYGNKSFTEQANWTSFEIEIDDFQLGILPESLAIFINPYSGGTWDQSANSPDGTSNHFYLDSLYFVYSNSLGIENHVALNAAYNAYPNPFSNEVYIDGIKGNEDIFLVNQDGKLVFSHDCSMDKIDLSALSKGVYLLKIMDAESGKQEIIRVIKKE